MIEELNESIIIRDIKENDIDYIYEIEVLSFNEAYSKSLLYHFIKNLFCLSILIEYNKVIVGYALGLLKFGKIGHIVSIAIHPSYRKLGFGTILLKKLIELFEKNNKTIIQLEVRIDNYEAIKLYQKFNFKIIGIKENYYMDGKDAYFMELNLDNNQFSKNSFNF